MRAKRFLASSFARTLETIVSIVAGLIMMPLMIRLLGEDLYGIWIVIGSIIGSLYLFDIGMASSVTRFISFSLSRDDREQATRVVSTAFAIYSCLALIVFAASVIIAFFSGYIVENPDNTRLVQILIIIVGMNVAVEFPFKSYAGIAGYHLRQDLMSYSQIIFRILGAALTAYLLYAGYKLIAVALVQFTVSLLSNLVFRYIAYYLEPKLRVRLKTVDRPTFKEIFGFSSWSFVIDLTRLLKERGDVWMVAAFTSPALLTVYYVGVRLVEYSNQLLYKAFGFTLPLYTEAIAREDDQELERKVKLFLRLNTLVSGIVLIGAVLFGRDVIRIWMGDSFSAADAAIVFIVLLAAKLLVFITNPFTNVLFAMAKHRYQAYVSGAEAITSLALIPVFMQVLDNPLLAAALAIGLPFTITRTLIVPFIVQRNTRLSVALLYKTLLPLVIPILVFGYLCHLLLATVAPSAMTLLALLGFIALIGVVYGAFVLLILLTGEERQLLLKGLGVRGKKQA
ncbi:lipopolysaccharide biosynthesis protein [Marinobacter mobilis]|uniref:Membrane protein involved in the export of O-antigen and teichoic acid n=1 Tax=Marinobacter mobilis TaxID=488533 RepID=A0A1H2UWJ0_9GAMM|nr:oligosaccharide flippase family protein [Marinobacter mobilis]SDW60378.1 Membrane protein involved in the export of O-antigen and teichoic acid [Marinobacter mobilis]